MLLIGKMNAPGLAVVWSCVVGVAIAVVNIVGRVGILVEVFDVEAELNRYILHQYLLIYLIMQ